MRHVGLLRLANGVLRPTRAAANEREVVRRLRTWFPSDEFTSLLASDAVAMLAAAGPLTGEELAGRLHPLYYGWSRNGRPLTQQDVQMSIEHRNREAEHPRSANFDVALLIATTNLSIWSG